MTVSDSSLEALLDCGHLARASRVAPACSGEGLATGYEALDAALPWKGWPRRGLIEILLDRHGCGELTLFVPLFRAVIAAGRRIAVIAPPFQLYAPALVQQAIPTDSFLLIEPAAVAGGLWAAETCLRAGACGAVLCWLDRLSDRALRRLQLAAEDGAAPLLLYRPMQFGERLSPAVLRLAVSSGAGPELIIDLLKCRGRPPRRVQVPGFASA